MGSTECENSRAEVCSAKRYGGSKTRARCCIIEKGGDFGCEEITGDAEQTEKKQGNLEIAKQMVEKTRKKANVHATFTRNARHKSHIMRGHEIALLLKH